MKKTNYDGVIGWINYIRDYKHNKEYLEIKESESVENKRQVRKLNKKLNKEILDKTLIATEKDNLLALREQHIDNLGESLKKTKIENAKLQNTINILNAQLDDAEEKNTDLLNTLDEKNKTIKQLNMRYAQSQRKTQKLEKDIQRKDHKIKFLLASKEAPSKEKVMAYEKRMREVEKRQKEKAK